MADVDVEITQVSGIYGVRPNETLGDAIYETMTELGSFSISDAAFATELRDSLGDVSDALEKLPPAVRYRAMDRSYLTEPIEAPDAGETGAYSTDSGDVSQVVPLGRMRTATWPVGTPPHSWQAVAASGSTGVEGMVYAAKAIGGTLGRLLADPELLSDVVGEFERRGGADGYASPMSGEADPYELLGIEPPTFDLREGSEGNSSDVGDTDDD